MAMTITGANGEVINLVEPSGRIILTANKLQGQINSAISGGTAEAFDITPTTASDTPSTTLTPVGIVKETGTYTPSANYTYLVVAEDSTTNTAESGAVTFNGSGSTTSKVNVLAGRASGITYNAKGESGQLISTAGDLVFNGAGQKGSWTVMTGNGNNTITTTYGTNSITTGTGKSSIVLNTDGGNNQVFSQGQDTITGGSVYGYQSITLFGSNSDVNLGGNVLMANNGSGSTISLGKNSTITGGTSATITLTSGGSNNSITGGRNNTVTAVGSDGALKTVYGDGWNVSTEQDLSVFNAMKTNSFSGSGQLIVFGFSGANDTMGATGKSSLFVAAGGNETLDGSTSTATLQIFANSVAGATTSLVATGGSANDTLVGGSGNATFTGGAGDNVFQFDKNTATNGNTVISDFAKAGSSNKIALYNFGLNNDSLTALLKSSSNDTSGNAVLALTGHTITVQGVAVADLNASEFIVANPSAGTV